MYIGNENYYTVAEVAEILKLSKNCTYRMVNQPDFPKVRLGRVIRIPQTKFEEFMSGKIYKQYDFD